MAFRFASFMTDSFETRQYVYEKDVQYAFSMPALNGDGIRLYGYIKRDFKDWTIWIKVSSSLLNGPVENNFPFKVNKNQEMKIQIRYKL